MLDLISVTANASILFENFIVETREGKDVSKHMDDDQWLKDFSWGERTRAQLNVYIKDGRK